jgi:hypothetical protein
MERVEHTTKLKKVCLKLILHHALPFGVSFFRALKGFLILPPRLSSTQLGVHFLWQSGKVERA